MTNQLSLGERVKGCVKVEGIPGFGICMGYVTLDHDTGQEAVACRLRQTCTSWCQLT